MTATSLALRVVVADDEPIAAASLADALRALGCDVVAVTTRGDAAIRACEALSPDACFTDVLMPQTDGLAVARTLATRAPGVRVVFVSAHPQFAVDAFGADVIDYVLKPVRRERLQEAVVRVQGARLSRDDGNDERLLVPERGAVHVVSIREIEWVQADRYSVWLHTPRRAWMLRERMHRLEERLTSAGFIRVHRSALVRRSAIVSIESSGEDEPQLTLRSGAQVRVARERVRMVRDAIAE